MWQEVVRLIEDPTLIQAELDRRLDAARGAEPTKRRQDALERERTRIRKSMERLVTAYQEDLLPLDELRRRMPELRAREQSARAELQAILDQAADRMSFLRLAETLVAFLQRLHESAQSLEIADRQKIVRLLVKDILVDNDTITIRHSIPSHPRTPPHGTEPPSDAKSQMDGQGYLLRSGSADRALRRPLHRLDLSALFKQPCRQPFADQPDDPPVADPMLNKPYQPCMADRVEERPNIRVEDPIDPPLPQPVRERVQRIVLSTLRPEPVTEPQEFRLVDRRQDRRHRRLDNLVLQRGNAQRSTPPIRLRNIPSTRGQRSIPSPMHTCVKALEVCLQALLVLCPRQPIDPRRGVLLQSEESRPQNIDADMMQECGQRLCSVPGYGFSYASLRM